MGEHDNHRKRLRDAFLINGLDSFNEHQVVELLLFFGIPRIDTNVIAHRLVARFGTIRGMFSASYDELMEVDGIGENSAALILLMSELIRRHDLSGGNITEKYTTVKKVGELLTAIYMGKSREQVFMLIFNGQMELTDIVNVGIGSFNAASISIRSIVETALKKQAAGIVISHNHPSGSALPSGEDVELTAQIDYICSQVGIPLWEHIIVAGDQFHPIMHEKQFRKKLREYAANET